MRKLCPNFDREDGLDTVLEVPIPEELFPNTGSGNQKLQNLREWMKSQAFDKATEAALEQLASKNELQLLLHMLGTPLLPCIIPHDRAFSRSIRDSSIQASTAKYIIQQYIAATGGQAALMSVNSMYAVGKVKMGTSEFHAGDQNLAPKSDGEIGGYVIWQKSPDLYYFELIMGGYKLSAGSDGKVAWRQKASRQTHAFRGPPRHLRRFIQGLDPRSTANLFADAVCIGEKIIRDHECFILKMDTNAANLKARSAPNFDIIHDTIWGYFSQRTGVLIQLEDSQLVRMKAPGRRGESIFWETSMESVIEDYRYINGINIAHGGKTAVTLCRYGEGSVNHKRRLEEKWTIEEVDFNLWGMSMDCFLPPSELKRDEFEN